MSKCEFINKVKATEYGSEELVGAILELEQECKKCTHETCKCEPEEIDEIDDLVDQLEEEGFIEYIEEECTCDDCDCDCKDEEETDAESLLVLQEVEKENIRMTALYDNQFEVEENELTLKAQREAEALGVFFRTLVAAGMSTTEAYNLSLNRQTSEANLEQAKMQQISSSWVNLG